MRALKGLLAALPPKTHGLADGRLKALVQDLSRFAREARENYASAIGKLAFRERIEDVAERTLIVWRDAVERADAAREPLEALAKVPRFGEVQVEKTLALMRELNEQKRIQKSPRARSPPRTRCAWPSATRPRSRRSIRWPPPRRRCKAASTRTGSCSPASSTARRRHAAIPTSARASSRRTAPPCASCSNDLLPSRSR
jgi:hypothetical protein